GAEGDALRDPGYREGEGGEVRRLLQPRAGHHDSVPHARTAPGPREEDDVGDLGGAEERAVQVLPGSRRARAEYPPSGAARCEAHRDGDLRPDAEVPLVRRSMTAVRTRPAFRYRPRSLVRCGWKGRASFS